MDARRNSSSNLNASASAEAPAEHASAVHFPAALSSASIGGPLTHTHAAAITVDEQSSSRISLTDSAVSLACTPASAGESVSVRKRAASAVPDAGSSSAATDESEAAGPSASSAAADSSSSDELSQRQPQSKKHRGVSAQVGRSQAPAAVSAGVDPQRADPINAAVSSASAGDGHSSSAVFMTDATSSGALADERKEASQAADSAVSVGLAAACAEASGSSAPVTRPCLFDDGKILWLVDKGIDLAESALQRLEEQGAPQIAQVTQLLADLDAQLQAILTLAAAAQFLQLQVPLQNRRILLQGQIDGLSRVLNHHAYAISLVREKIEWARAATTATAVPLQALGSLCVEMYTFVALMLPTDPPRGLRAWLQRVDLLFTQIAERLPQLTLSSDECRELLSAALNAGALQLVPALLQQPHMRDGCDPFSSCLRHFCRANSHFVSRQPYLRLFRYGLDPTHIIPQQSPLSVLQLARNFIRDHPPPAVQAAGESAVMTPVAASSSSGPAHVGPIPSDLAAVADQQREPTEEAENRRRVTLHARFMHALIPAWLSHSRAVLALLSSTSVLIPDLASIVGRYLDLEGLPAEAAETVDEDDAQTDAEQ